MLLASRLPLLRRQTESAGVEAILARAMEYTGVSVEKSTRLVTLSELLKLMLLFDSFAQLPVSCRLSWRKDIENAPVFGPAIRARQARATNKSAFGADVPVPIHRPWSPSEAKVEGSQWCVASQDHAGLMMPRWQWRFAAEHFRQHLCLGPSPSCILQYFPEDHPPIASLSS